MHCECLGAIIEYSRSRAPMVWTRHNENINMHGRDAARYRKPARPLVPTCVRVAHARQVRTFRRVLRTHLHVLGFPSRVPSALCSPYPKPDDGATRATPSETPLQRNEPFSDDANPTIVRIHPPLRSCVSLPVVSLPLFRTSLTCGEQHRLRRL